MDNSVRIFRKSKVRKWHELSWLTSPSPVEYHYSIVTLRLKAGIVEPEETSIARQRLSNHVTVEMNAHATIEQRSYAIRF
jgi:hypothetical protein